MAKSYEVLGMLIPNGGYVQIGDTYEGIKFLECEPLTKEEYEAGFAAYDLMKKQEKESNLIAKQAVLERLGITAEEATLLLS